MYVTVAEVKAVETVVGKTDSQYTGAIVWAVAVIEKITGDVFESNTLTLRITGSGTHRLNLYPATLLRCLSITSITDIPSGVVVNSSYYVIYSRFLMMVEEAIVRAGVLAETWPIGTKNLRVIGSFGWSAVPEPVKQATILLAIAKLKVTGGGSAIKGKLSSERIGDYSYSRKVGETKGMYTGISEVDEVLELFGNRFIAVNVV